MTYRSVGGDFMSSFVPSVIPAPFDYLWGGPGLAELQRVGVETVKALLSAKGDYVHTVRFSSDTPSDAQFVGRNQSIAAIWDLNTAVNFASFLVTSLVYEQKLLTKGQVPVTTLGDQVKSQVATRLFNGGDPAGCMQDFQQSFAAWRPLPPITKTPTAWCKRELLLSKNSCALYAACARNVDPKTRVVSVVYVPAPPAGTVITPGSGTLVPSSEVAPTHAEIEARVAVDPTAQIDQQALAEFGAYLSALAQARGVLTMGLGLAASATDAEVWSGLSSHGIAPPMAIDWFVGCDADLSCFRQRMNLALGGSEQELADGRVKFWTAALALGAVGYAAYLMRRRG